MQDKYAGDIGDFGKFALLRALAPDRRLGVCWYAVESEVHNNDGRHTAYLAQPERFRSLDPVVFDALKGKLSDGGPRSIRRLEELGLLPGAVFHGRLVPRSRSERHIWFQELRQTIKTCELVFLDPDNGISFGASSHKAVALDEIQALAKDGHALLVYHHQGRLKGGASQEYARAVESFRAIGITDAYAVRLRPYSSRFYFLVNGGGALRDRLQTFARHWGRDKAEFFGPL
ncbi:MAG: hypothetical protein JNM50_13800 [Chromatiales bacterium]|nr:hypothetical protein [Chromatiales bacterium]